MRWNAGDFVIMFGTLAGCAGLVLFGTGHI